MRHVAAVVLAVAVSGCASVKVEQRDAKPVVETTTMCSLPTKSAAKQATVTGTDAKSGPPSCQPMQPAEPTQPAPSVTPETQSQTAFVPLLSVPPGAAE